MNASTFAKFAAALTELPKEFVSSFKITIDHKDGLGFTDYTVTDTTDVFYPYAVFADVYYADNTLVQNVEVGGFTTELDAIKAIKSHKKTF